MSAQIMSSPLRPIELSAGVRIEVPVILAPMSGVTDLPSAACAASRAPGWW
jgi:hypothetical protein